ncbi:hypothetical protein ACFPL7_02945 [Dongia soli]|uniref:Uncharacterized protein n=1 Tax=Dongia soli TaxID=600628 RepID=A0ABU5EHQ6_9PROT|nr:hypothetical protein [Dongia soli]MDY0885746.1 hypothetical protein [Dongia soli]
MINRRRIILPAIAALWTVSGLGASPALAQEAVPQMPADAPVLAPISQRFVLMVLDQPDRNINLGSSRINMMYDTKTGRSWVLQYTSKPNSNQQGFVWVEVPYAAPPRQ